MRLRAIPGRLTDARNRQFQDWRDSVDGLFIGRAPVYLSASRKSLNRVKGARLQLDKAA